MFLPCVHLNRIAVHIYSAMGISAVYDFSKYRNEFLFCLFFLLFSILSFSLFVYNRSVQALGPRSQNFFVSGEVVVSVCAAEIP